MHLCLYVQLHNQKHNKIKPAKNKHGELYYMISQFSDASNHLLTEMLKKILWN